MGLRISDWRSCSKGPKREASARGFNWVRGGRQVPATAVRERYLLMVGWGLVCIQHCGRQGKPAQFAWAFLISAMLALSPFPMMPDWAAASWAASNEHRPARAMTFVPPESAALLRQALYRQLPLRIATASNRSYQRFIDAPEAAFGVPAEKSARAFGGKAAKSRGSSLLHRGVAAAQQAARRPAPHCRPAPILLPRPKAYAK